MNQQPLPSEQDVDPVTPGKTRPWSAWTRLGLLAVFIATLPFAWGETSSCNGPSHEYTGYDQMTRSSSNVIAYVIIFGTPVLLGFGQYLVRPAWVRLGFDFASTVISSFGTFFCFLSILGGNLFARTSRVYVAPWIASLATLLTTVDTFAGSMHHLRTILEARRTRNATTVRPPDAPPNE